MRAELRRWLADRLTWWAYQLDPDRFVEQTNGLCEIRRMERGEETVGSKLDENARLRELLALSLDGLECPDETKRDVVYQTIVGAFTESPTSTHKPESDR